MKSKVSYSDLIYITVLIKSEYYNLYYNCSINLQIMKFSYLMNIK